MKKILTVIAALLGLSALAFAGMDDVQYRISTVTTNAGSATYVVRGSLEAVNLVIPSGKTASVSVATSSGQTLFTRTAATAATDGIFPVLFPAYDAAGTAILTNNFMVKFPLAEAVTVTVTPAANTTETNTYTTTLIVNE